MLPATPVAAELLPTVLAVSLTAVHLVRPLYEPDSTTITDFALEYVNLAGQQMTGLAERPGGTLLTRFPHTLATGIFDFYCRAFTADEQLTYEVNYQAEGFNNYFRFAAKRYGEQLVVSFDDTNKQDRTPVEMALRLSQANEQAKRAEAEAQQATLYHTFAQAPVAIAILEGPAHMIQFANAGMGVLWGRPVAQLIGRPHFEALPDLGGQGFEAIFDYVYQTGQQYSLREQLVHIDRVNTGVLVPGYFNIAYQPLYDGQQRITGVIASAIEVTEQVLARQQVQDLNEELATMNEELRASNEEYLVTNTALSQVQEELQLLNKELEARVHERSQALEAVSQRLAQEREGFYQILEQTPAAICIMRGPEHRYAYSNKAHAERYGGRPPLGRTVADMLPDAAAQGYLALLDKVYYTGEVCFGYEAPVRAAEYADRPASTAYFNFTYSPYHEGGQLVGISSFSYEVTEQVLAKQQRQAQQHLVEAVFEQSPAAIFVLRGPTYVIEIVNPLAASLLGYPREHLLGQPYLEAVPEAAQQGYVELLRGVWESGEPVVLQDQPACLTQCQPGEESYYNLVYQPLRDAQGQVVSIACVALNVTDQVLARQRVQDLNKELAAINEEVQATNKELHESNSRLTRTNADLDNFIYTASHDLKQPISNIEGLLRLLEELLPDAVRREELVAPVLSRMQGAVERFTRTISHLTEVSKLQAEFDQPPVLVALGAVVEDVRQDLLPQLTAAGARLDVAVADCEPRVFSQKNLRSIIYNLLSNSIKYRAPDRPLVVRLTCAPATGERLVLKVADNGLGLEQGQQGRLFQLFQRLHTHVEGTGLGLYMVKKIVENAGGTITVASQANVGTTFTLSFPE
jgi:PAS domain S-box-containing protein